MQVGGLRRVKLGGRSLVWLAFGVSGAAGLVYEVVWARMLARAFGSTAPATATVLAVFMAGLGLGAALAGRVVDRWDRATCLGRYAGLELAAAALGVASPFALAALPDLYAGATEAMAPGSPARTLLRVGIAVVALAPATLMMGATLPIIVRAERTAGSGPARAFGLLYALNTLGAASGALAAALLLLPWIGELRTAIVAAVGNVVAAALALAARAAARRTEQLAQIATTARASEGATAISPQPPDTPGGATAAPPWPALGAALATGFTMLGFQIVWARTIVMTLGASEHALAVVLSLVLVAIVCGSLPAARWADRAREPRAIAGVLVVASSLGALALLALAPTMALVALAISSERATPTSLLVTPLIVASPLVFAPAAVSAVALTFVVRAGTRVGASAGAAYAANTGGAVVGSLLTGLVLVPALGSYHTAWVLAGVGALGGAVAWISARPAGRRIVPVVSVVVLAAIATLLARPVDLRIFGAGMHMMSRRARALAVSEGLDVRLIGREVLLAREGPETTVIVERQRGGRTFFVGGKPEASDLPEDIRNQYMLGHVPALLHRRPERALVVGLGSGMTAGTLARHARVDVAELSSAVVEAARLFADLNHGVVDDPRVRVVREDGRTMLRACRARYDVVSVDPIHPYVAGAATLYTRDYFELVARCLRRGGVAAHWLPLYQLSSRDAEGVIRSFQDVFADATVYLTGGDAILIGGAGAALPRPARFAHGYARADVARDLARVYLDSPERLAAAANCGGDVLRRLTGWAPAITDDLTWIAVTAPLSAQVEAIPALGRLLRVRAAAPADASVRERVARRSYALVLRLRYVVSVEGRPPRRMLPELRRALADDPTNVELAQSIARLR